MEMQPFGENGQIGKITDIKIGKIEDVNTKESAGRAPFCREKIVCVGFT